MCYYHNSDGFCIDVVAGSCLGHALHPRRHLGNLPICLVCRHHTLAFGLRYAAVVKDILIFLTSYDPKL